MFHIVIWIVLFFQFVLAPMDAATADGVETKDEEESKYFVRSYFLLNGVIII